MHKMHKLRGIHEVLFNNNQSINIENKLFSWYKLGLCQKIMKVENIHTQFTIMCQPYTSVLRINFGLIPIHASILNVDGLILFLQ